MERREPPPTEEGWYALHDFRSVDWDAWRGATEREREAAIGDGRDYVESAVAVDDAEEGASAAYAVNGHKADLLLVHLRPALSGVNALERRFEGTALAGLTERAHSYVSVTEVSGYTDDARAFFEGGQVEDRGLANYIEARLYPSIPDAEHVCFYPMDKRRDPEYNWYDLPFEERAEHMGSHGDIGRGYGGKVTQMITGSIGLDDWEWGVTLWANDPVEFKRLLYEMRFDPSTSKFAEFGPFFTGQRLVPGDLGRFLAGEHLGEDGAGGSGDDGTDPTADEGAEAAPASGGSGEKAEVAPTSGRPDANAGTDGAPGEGIREELEDLDIYAGKPHGEDVYAIVLYSEADPGELFEEVRGLRANFEHYDTHVKTAVYESGGGRTAVASIWETERAAETASGFLSELPDVVGRADEESGFGTMGMFYTVKPEHRGEFVETFDEVGEVLDGMDGHLDTALLENREDENDMFIASQWRSREDAMAFFRSEAFAETVSWGREVLADRPRHVFLA